MKGDLTKDMKHDDDEKEVEGVVGIGDEIDERNNGGYSEIKGRKEHQDDINFSDESPAKLRTLFHLRIEIDTTTFNVIFSHCY